MNAELESIKSYCELVRKAQIQPLGEAERARERRLKHALRALIDGALTEAEDPPETSDETPVNTAAKAPVKTAAQAPAAQGLDAQSLTDEAPLPEEPAAWEASPVAAASNYTPPTSRLFLDDYYGTDIAPSWGDTRRPAGLVNPSGESVPASPEIKLLYEFQGLTQDIEAYRSRKQANPLGGGEGTRSAILHREDGSVLHGSVTEFDPEAEDFELVEPRRKTTHRVVVSEVSALFLGPPSIPLAWQDEAQLEVTLESGRELSGLAPDFDPDAPWLLLILDKPRGQVDRVWLPKRALRALKLKA